MKKADIYEQVKMGKLYGVWTVEAVATLFGVSQMSVYRWIKLGKLEAIKLGNSYIVTTGALRKFFEDEYHVVYRRRYTRRLREYVKNG